MHRSLAALPCSATEESTLRTCLFRLSLAAALGSAPLGEAVAATLSAIGPDPSRVQVGEPFEVDLTLHLAEGEVASALEVFFDLPGLDTAASVDLVSLGPTWAAFSNFHNRQFLFSGLSANLGGDRAIATLSITLLDAEPFGIVLAPFALPDARNDFEIRRPEISRDRPIPQVFEILPIAMPLPSVLWSVGDVTDQVRDYEAILASIPVSGLPGSRGGTAVVSPEPATLALLGLGLTITIAWRTRRDRETR